MSPGDPQNKKQWASWDRRLPSNLLLHSPEVWLVLRSLALWWAVAPRGTSSSCSTPSMRKTTSSQTNPHSKRPSWKWWSPTQSHAASVFFCNSQSRDNCFLLCRFLLLCPRWMAKKMCMQGKASGRRRQPMLEVWCWILKLVSLSLFKSLYLCHFCLCTCFWNPSLSLTRYRFLRQVCAAAGL